MHRVLTLAVLIFVAATSGAGAQGNCSACNMLYQQGAAQCQAFQYNYQQYQYCMMVTQQNVGRCMQTCAAGGMGGYGGGYAPGPGYPPAVNRPLCQQYPNNPACR